MYNNHYNSTVILNTVLPLVFGEDIPTPVTRLPEGRGDGTHVRYRRETESLLHRWEICASKWEDGAEMVSIDTPSFKEGKYIALHAVWTNYKDTAPYLSLYMSDRIWKSEVKVEDGATLEDQARAMVQAVLEAYERF